MCGDGLWERHGLGVGWLADGVVLIESYFPNDQVMVRFRNFILLGWEDH